MTVCAIRKIQVKATPEEHVRQKFLQQMIGEWGYPPSLIMVEKALSELPLQNDTSKKIPQRRMDIVAYTKTGESLRPLLLIECKEKDNSKKALRQLLGYNYFIQAPFVALVTATHYTVIDAMTSRAIDGKPFYSSLRNISPFSTSTG